MKPWKLLLSAFLALTLYSTMLVIGRQDQPILSFGNQQAAWNEEEPFTYSKGIDENGYWKGIRASDYVTLADNYLETEIPSDVSTVSDEDLQSQIDSLVENYVVSEQIVDRAVADGDTLNIDYVGSIDGVEFEGGSTNGAGTEVTVGTTSYIDDFIQQLVGHTPGETFNIEVTFPEDYTSEELQGKDAVFVTTINHIVQEKETELTDDFVKENLQTDYGWTTVEEMKERISEGLRKNAIESYISDRILEKGEVSSVPDMLISYNEESLYSYYESSAESYDMEINEFLSSYVGVESMEDLLESYADTIKENAEYALIIQAIAEDQGIEAGEEDIAEYFTGLGSEDYSAYEENYGIPYLKQVVITQKVHDLLMNNVVFE